MERKGFYLYAVRPANHTDVFPEIKGIDGASKVFPVLVGDKMWAVVSHVSLKEFRAKEISEKAQNDLQWITGKSLLHNRVIMQSAEGTDGAIVPMKFGAIFKDKDSLTKAIKKDSKRFLRLFEKLKGKEEWSLKIFANPEAIKKEIMKSDAALEDKERELPSLPAGFAYFKEKELEEEIERRKRGEFQKWAQKILQLLPHFVDEVRVGKVLDKELNVKGESIILHAIVLIKKKKLEKLLKKGGKVRSMLEEKGLRIEMSGPWPPYNFV